MAKDTTTTTPSLPQDFTPAMMKEDFGDWSSFPDSQFTEFPILKVISDTSKLKNVFADWEQLGNTHLGKLYIKSRKGNTLDDLADSFTATIVKIQQGVIFRKDEKIIHVSSHPVQRSAIPEMAKEMGIEGFVNNEGKFVCKNDKTDKIQQLVRLMVMPDAPIVLSNQRKYPLYIVEISGTTWGSWLKTVQAMKQMALQFFKGTDWTDYVKVPPSFWRIAITAKQEEANGYIVYPLQFQLMLNDYKDAQGIRRFLRSTKDENSGLSFFDELEHFDLIALKSDLVPEKQEEKEVTEEELVDINDLPF